MNDGFSEFDELQDEAYQLSEYYSERVGRNVVFGIASDGEYWLRATRTNDVEYFSDLQEAERRVKMLYSDLIIDDWDDAYED